MGQDTETKSNGKKIKGLKEGGKCIKELKTPSFPSIELWKSQHEVHNNYSSSIYIKLL